MSPPFFFPRPLPLLLSLMLLLPPFARETNFETEFFFRTGLNAPSVGIVVRVILGGRLGEGPGGSSEGGGGRGVQQLGLVGLRWGDGFLRLPSCGLLSVSVSLLHRFSKPFRPNGAGQDAGGFRLGARWMPVGLACTWRGFRCESVGCPWDARWVPVGERVTGGFSVGCPLDVRFVARPWRVFSLGFC